ncbi:MFS transporter [Lactobacillus sp. CBA3605]|uniref:MFS transporter n=1 Tax=Lactobacillus sp. CBA3605 TaxID=2099788 RepID=UPI000CFB4D4C|nr:MFS transporter [Lactobacillus sp. CBA3605]AVK61757.1 MFS transporter [Lactobacillus sp. CBA3605]
MAQRVSFFSRDMIGIMIATFFYQFSIQAINPLINGYARNLGVNSALTGIIVGVMSITSMLLRPFAGNLTDRVSKYQLAFIGGVLCAISDLGYLWSTNATELLFARMINGVGFVLCTVCLATWLAFLVPRQHVGKAMGYYGLLNAVAMAIAPAIAISLYQHLGYRFILILAAISAVAMIIVIQFIGNQAKPQASIMTVQHFKVVQRDALPAAIIISLLSIPYFTTLADIVMYVETLKLNVTVGLFFVAYSVILFAIRIILKDYFDKIAFGIWFYICLLATIAYIILLTIMKNNVEMILAAGMMAVGFGIMVSICESTALLLAPITEQGLANSTYFLGIDIGMALGPILGGAIPAFLPLKLLYPIMLTIVPLVLIIYVFNRHKLNSAVQYNPGLLEK